MPIDLHGASVGLPTAEGWVPVVSAETPLPGRAWGLSGGANVYLLKLGVMTFGVGAQLATGRGKGELPSVTTAPGTDAGPDHNADRDHADHEPAAAGVDELRAQAGMELPERGLRADQGVEQQVRGR